MFPIQVSFFQPFHTHGLRSQSSMPRAFALATLLPLELLEKNINWHAVLGNPGKTMSRVKYGKYLSNESLAGMWKWKLLTISPNLETQFQLHTSHPVTCSSTWWITTLEYWLGVCNHKWTEQNTYRLSGKPFVYNTKIILCTANMMGN